MTIIHVKADSTTHFLTLGKYLPPLGLFPHLKREPRKAGVLKK